MTGAFDGTVRLQHFDSSYFKDEPTEDPELEKLLREMGGEEALAESEADEDGEEDYEGYDEEDYDGYGEEGDYGEEEGEYGEGGGSGGDA